MRRNGLSLSLIAAICALAPLASVSLAEAADFYRGKQVTIIVGYTPGGTYDLTARLYARGARQLSAGQACGHRAEHAGRGQHGGGREPLQRRAEGRHDTRRGGRRRRGGGAARQSPGPI
jgi:hypothetical protein